MPPQYKSRRELLRRSASLAALLAIPGAALCSASANLNIGILLPRSGYLAGAGNTCFQGARLALGLLLHPGSPRFNLMEADTGETAESAMAAARRTIAAGAHILIGCYDSAQTVAVAALCEERCIPLVINIAAAPSITQQGYRYVFRNFPDARRIVVDSYDLQRQLFTATGYKPRKLALLYINNGRGIETITELWPEMHMPYEIAAAIGYDPKAEDLSKEVAAARASGADLLWTVSRPDDAIRITRELVKQTWTPAAIMSSNAGLHEPGYRLSLGKYADYAITFAPYFDPQKPLTRQLQHLQMRLYPDAPLGTLQVYTFEAVLIAVDAFRRARSVDPKALSDALRTTAIKNNVTPGPGIAFDATGQNQGLKLIALQNLAGQPQVILPSAAAQAQPILPMPAWSDRS
ncbi:MAG TPA: ABC transporter substrate-binding protein [Steroidobacteraceae bacterium]